jgi:hypothetical protein
LIEPNTNCAAAGFDDIDQPLGILNGDLGRKDKNGIPFKFDETERSRQLFDEKFADLHQYSVRVSQLVTSQKSNVTRNIRKDKITRMGPVG